MKPYIHYCQNTECDSEIEVEIESFTPDTPDDIRECWEDSSPGSSGEVWYKIPVCPHCGTVQVDDKKIYKKVFNHALDCLADGDF
jgi:hypothetical protein